ncbi:hypothetical protein [Phormidium nigroviride]
MTVLAPRHDRKTSQDVSYSSSSRSSKSYKSGSEILKIWVNGLSLYGIEATERGFRESFVEDVSISQPRSLPQQQDVNKSLVAPTNREEDVLDWDFSLENPPIQPTSTIELKFEYGGRSKPIPVTDPWDE